MSNKFVVIITLISSFMLVGVAKAAPVYNLTGGVAATFDSTNSFGLLPEGQIFSGFRSEFNNPITVSFLDQLQVVFTTTTNTISLNEGVIGFTTGIGNTGYFFDNQDLALTLSPAPMEFRLQNSDFNIGGISSVDYLIVDSGGVSSGGDRSADSSANFVQLGDNSFAVFGLFDERNPTQGMYAFNVSAIPPVPEPHEYLMMIVGLGVVFMFVRKRKEESESIMALA